MPENTRVYNIKFEVRIHTRRNGLRTVFANDVLRVDVNTTKNGFNSTWRVILAPRDYDSDGVSAYDMVEAMDYCEIAVKRFEDKPKVVIRGFVTTVFKSFVLRNGKPERYIAISGEDYGKIIRMAYIHYAEGLDPLQVIAARSTDAPLLAGFGVDMATKPTSTADVIEQIFNVLVLPNFKNITKLIDQRDQKFPATLDGTSSHDDKFGDFLTDIDKDGVNGVRGLNCNFKIFDRLAGAKETPVESFLIEMAGLPWNEIFIDNAPTSSFLVYRPAPYRDRDGNFIGATHLAGVDGTVVASDRADTDTFQEIPQEDVLSYQFERNDKEVFNYFFTDASYSLISESFEQYMKSVAIAKALKGESFSNPHYTVGEVDLDEGQTNIPLDQHRKIPASNKLEYSRMELFGFKKYAQVSKYLSVRTATEDIAETYTDGTASDPSMVFTGEKLNDLLFNAFEHVSVLETGVMVIKGNENVRPGMFVRFTDDRLKPTSSIYYVTDVNHTIVPFETFTTTLIVTRGEGHLDKLRNAGGKI